MIRSSFHHGSEDAVAVELGHVFGKDLTEACIVCNEVMKTSGEYYCFVDCVDYGSHVEALIGSPAVGNVISSYDTPERFSDKDVDEFVISADCQNSQRPLEIGDVVCIRKGFMEGLHGIVEDISDPRAPTVHFRFYTREFSEILSCDRLELTGNIFDFVKAPIMLEGKDDDIPFPEVRKAVSKVVGNSQIRRRSNRKRPKKR
jgi:hypothetical protein